MKRATLLALTVSACLLTGCTNALKDGTGYLEDGNYKEAVTAFQKAVDEGKKTAEAYRGLGMAYYEQEDYASAKDAFEKALAAGGEKNQVIYNLLGICGMKLNDYNYALEQFNQGISLSQNRPWKMQKASAKCFRRCGSIRSYVMKSWVTGRMQKPRSQNISRSIRTMQMPREKQNFWRPDKEYKGRRGYADCGEDSAVSVLYSRG